MKCHQCGQRGKPQGRMWYTPKKRTPRVLFRCTNPACWFEYVTFDGQLAKGRPLWLVPLKEIR